MTVRHGLGFASAAAIAGLLAVNGATAASAAPLLAPTSQPAAIAEAATDAPQSPTTAQDTCYYENHALYPKRTGQRTVWMGGPNWNVTGIGPGTLVLEKSSSVSNSWNGTASISASAVSTGVGFDSTKTTDVSTSFQVPLAAGEKRTINAGHIDDIYTFEIWRGVKCYPGGGVWQKGTKLGTGNAYKFARLTYRSVAG